MPDIPPGWSTVDAAIITAFGGGVIYFAARIFRRLKHVESDAAETRNQVANEHKDADGNAILMRDDQDQKHDKVVGMVGEALQRLEGLDGRLDGVERDMRGLKKDVGRLGDTDLEQQRQQNRDRERLDRIEHTLPKPVVRRMVEDSEEPDE